MATVAEFIQCDSRNYTAGRGGTAIDRIVVHYTGTSASAHNNLLYFSRSSAAASAHYFIDKDGTIRQSVKESDRAWHAGNWAMNCRSVGIEVVSAGEDFTDAQIASLKELIADIKGRYTIGDVIRHYDVTGKKCPAPYVDATKWAALKASITGTAASSSSSGSSSGSSGSSSSSLDLGDTSYWGPKFTSAMQTQLGTTVDGIISGQSSASKKYHANIQSSTIEYTASRGGSIMVRAIQRKLGAYYSGSVDGLLGPGTISAMQTWLKQLGYYSGSVDKTCGPATCQAVAKAIVAGKFKG